MDTLSLCLAFGPMAIYLVLLGLINRAAHPLITTGTRETVALALAASGLVIVGPMRLFMPEEAAGAFGGFVWLLLIGLYVLAVTLAIILSPPRLVVFNAAIETVEQALLAAARRVDVEARWAGRALSLPNLRVHLRLDPFHPLACVSLVATGYEQSTAGWKRLEKELARELRTAPAPARAHGVWLLLWGLAILAVLARRVVSDPQQIAQEIERLLRP